MVDLHDIEPFYGWLHLYNHQMDAYSPFHEVEHNEFYFDRSVNQIPAHPLWDDIGSESLLVKILYADYEEGYAIIELFGEWNDLFENDYKLLSENCFSYLIANGVSRIILICENVFHSYFQSDDYYEALQDELGEDGWICLLRAREPVLTEMQHYGIDAYFFWSELLDSLNWRKMKPPQLFAAVHDRLQRTLLP